MIRKGVSCQEELKQGVNKGVESGVVYNCTYTSRGMWTSSIFVLLALSFLALSHSYTYNTELTSSSLNYATINGAVGILQTPMSHANTSTPCQLASINKNWNLKRNSRMIIGCANCQPNHFTNGCGPEEANKAARMVQIA